MGVVRVDLGALVNMYLIPLCLGRAQLQRGPSHPLPGFGSSACNPQPCKLQPWKTLNPKP